MLEIRRRCSLCSSLWPWLKASRFPGRQLAVARGAGRRAGAFVLYPTDFADELNRVLKPIKSFNDFMLSHQMRMHQK
jgi:hypothetical protein